MYSALYSQNFERDNFFCGFTLSKYFSLFFFSFPFFAHVKMACHYEWMLVVALTDLSETNWRSYVI